MVMVNRVKRGPTGAGFVQDQHCHPAFCVRAANPQQPVGQRNKGRGWGLADASVPDLPVLPCTVPIR